jgi:periplasmic protein CpxP/Spy
MKLGRILKTTGAVALVGALAAPLAAQQAPTTDGNRERGSWQGRDGGRRGSMHGSRGMRAMAGIAGLRGLDLTDAQRQQVRSIVEARQSDFRAIGERLHAAQRAQHEAITRVPVDENEVRARAGELAAVQADAAVLRARIHEQVHQVLTPEQQAKAKQLQAEREKRRAERMERMKQRRQQRQRQPQPQ